jgi:outer membrane beta-barrel protein
MFLLVNLSFAEEEKKKKDDLLWLDPDKAVYVLQKKKHPKDGRFYTDVNLSRALNNKFTNVSGINFKAGYHVKENWALEIQHGQNSNTKNIDYKNIKEVSDTEPFIRNVTGSTGLNVIYSPFYGKVNTFNKIFYVDWYFGVGAGVINYEDNKDTVDDPDENTTYESRQTSFNNVKTGIKAFMGDNSYINFEYNDQYYRTTDPGEQTSSLKSHGEVLFGVGFIF